MTPEVSVVVPHFGDSAPTLRLLRQLAAQQDAPAHEIIVVDDHSPTPFPEDPFPEDPPGRPASVRVVRRTANGGFGSAVNSGAAVAAGDLLVVLNSDVEIEQRFLADLVANARPWLPAVVSPRVVDADRSEAWTGRRFPTVRHQVVEWLVPFARWRDTQALHEAVGHDTRARGRPTAQLTDFVVGAAMLIPTATFRDVGGFDERFFMNSEEVDLQRRLRERAVPSVVLPAPEIVHEGGASSDPAARRRWLVEGRLRYADRWGRPRLLRAALATATAVNLVWNTGRRATGRPVRPLAVAADELALLRRREDATTRPTSG